MSEIATTRQNSGTMNPVKSLPVQIVELIQTEGLEVGSHLPAQLLADRLQVSRTPINEALALLHQRGLLERQKNRGYFLAKSLETIGLVERLVRDTADDEAVNAYFRIADDLLKGELPEEVSEALLRKRYGLTPAQLNGVLHRMSEEGWVQKKPRYGWRLQTMLTTPESLLQSYRLRLALEPAALLEPGYALDADVISRCRAAEHRLLDGAIETDTPDQLHERGVRFHESLIEASGNPFFIDTIRRVNRIRRLISYRSMKDRRRYREHCRQHLHILELLEAGRQREASDELRRHLERTLANHQKISLILKS